MTRTAVAVGMAPGGWARWAWRRLTSMRVALVLLTLLALAAVPGSVLPQRGVSSDPGAVVRFTRDHPVIAPWLERLGFFEVYSSSWFAAIYLLLLISMTGCVLPRCARLWRAVRAAPPSPPRVLSRAAGHESWATDEDAGTVIDRAASQLRRRRFRARVDGDAVCAEKGYVREAGNLLFHLSLLVLLLGVALGSLRGFEGRVIVVEGGGFSNTRALYDEFTPGPLTDTDRLTPFSFILTDFDAQFEPTGPQRGSAREFRADIEFVREPGASAEEVTIEVNHPLEVDGTKVFLTGNGYAPQVTVRDGEGNEVVSGATVFLPIDSNLTSEGVVKAPGARPTELGFEGFFLPTADVDPVRGPHSIFPDAFAPLLVLTAYTGDLGLNDGVSQSVYSLDTTAMEQVRVDGKPFARMLRVGETITLPDGQGSLTFDGVSRFANFQIAHDPGRHIALLAAVLLLTGLTASITVRRRQVWVVARADPAGRTTVDLGSRPLTRRGSPPGEIESLAEHLRREAVTTPATTAPTDPSAPREPQ